MLVQQVKGGGDMGARDILLGQKGENDDVNPRRRP